MPLYLIGAKGTKMRFEVGEKIRVMNRIGLQLVDTLNYANYVRWADSPRQLIVEILGKEYEVPNSLCYKWSPAPKCDIIMGKWALKRLPQIVKFITDALQGMYVVTPSISTQDQGIPCILILIDGLTISVEPCRMIRKCIGRINEEFGWSCTTYHSVSNYPHAPDVDNVEYGQSMNTLGIAQLAVRVYGEMLAENYWTHVNECQMVEELQAKGLIDES